MFELAHGGTLLLDEISAAPLGIQRDLLAAIEDRQIRRPGDGEAVRADVQIVASTRDNLEPLVKRGEFRADLYHRLSVRTLALPPLRERDGELLAIADLLVETLAIEHGMRAPVLDSAARAALLRHGWPGNISELRNELEHAMLACESNVIRADDLRFTGGAISIDGSGKITVTMAGSSCSLERLEREVIRQALEQCRNNVSRAARFLGITRQTLLYRIKKHELKTPANPDFDDR